jgi:hypothetical protein
MRPAAAAQPVAAPGASAAALPWRHGRVLAAAPPRPLCRRALQALPLPRRGRQPVRCGSRLPGGAADAPDEQSRRRDGGRDADAGGAGGLGALGGPLASASIVSRIWGDRPQNDGPINYAQFMEYLVNKRVTRLLIYDNGKTAIGAWRATRRAHAPDAAPRARRCAWRARNKPSAG